MLNLTNCAMDDQGRAVAAYQATDAEPGRSGTVLTFEVELITNAEGATARVKMDPTPAPTEEEAFDRLAEQLERAARALRGRGEPKFCVPAYGK